MDRNQPAFGTAAENPSAQNRPEITLDPNDWEHFRTLAHRALDGALDQMRSVRERPPWRPVPEQVRLALDHSLPERGQELEEVLAEYRELIEPYPTGNAHPRFWGWVMGNGTAEGMLADMLAAASNPHGAGYDQSASQVEGVVIRWLTQMLGYPAGASGLLLSGGTAANLTGVAVARRDKAPFDVRRTGLTAGPPLRLYGSSDTHSWAEKSCDLLGMGRGAVCRVRTHPESGQVDVTALQEAIRADRDRGVHPFCVIGNAGTVDAGAIDDLDALADLCRDEELWLHVDGAFGALVALVPELRPRLQGLERADSIAFDLHKWGYLQYELGCVLIKDAEAHRSAFRTSAAYLDSPGRGIQPAPLCYPELGLQLSRGFRALKVWMALKHHGTQKIGRVIGQNVAQAQHLVTRIHQAKELELLGPAPLNVVCFRYRPPSSTIDATELNREILLRLQERGVAVPSSTRRQGRFALRVAITNHRTRRADIDFFVDRLLGIAGELIDGDGIQGGDTPPS